MAKLQKQDSQVFRALQGEVKRQTEGMEMIASENYVSGAVLEALGSIFTNKYSDVKKDVDYLKWLNKIKKEDYPGQYTKNYIRRWTLPLTQYGKHYDYCDVCLAPIDSIDVHTSDKGQITNKINMFNLVKSELKIIEAGMKKKCLIAQDFGIYKELLKNGETGILISDNKDGWYKAMRRVIQEPEYREMLANNLHNFVKDKYELKNVTADRAEHYKNIVKNKKVTTEKEQTLTQ